MTNKKAGSGRRAGSQKKEAIYLGATSVWGARLVACLLLITPSRAIGKTLLFSVTKAPYLVEFLRFSRDEKG